MYDKSMKNKKLLVISSQFTVKYEERITNNSEPVKGFTLIELLIVVAIIGILAALLMTNFIGVRQRARDAQRKSDVRQLQSALELYRSDTGSYPASITSCGSGISLKSPDGSSTYMQTVPCDPLGISTYNNGVYVYSISGNVYTLGTCLENGSDNQGTAVAPTGCSANCSCTSNNYFVVQSP